MLILWYPRQDSNPDIRLRRPSLYPVELQGLTESSLLRVTQDVVFNLPGFFKESRSPVHPRPPLPFDPPSKPPGPIKDAVAEEMHHLPGHFGLAHDEGVVVGQHHKILHPLHPRPRDSYLAVVGAGNHP